MLKLDLFCRGAHLDDSLFVEGEGGRPILRTRAGLGSGLEVVLPGGHWTNVPVSEDFVRSSPYVVRGSPAGPIMLWRDGEPLVPLALAPCPAWYARRTASGRRMSRIGTLQGTYLAVYPGRVCAFWEGESKRNCHFCSVGLNLGADDASDKTVLEVLEVARAAVTESNVTYIDFNAGHDDAERALDRLEPYLRRVKAATGLLVGVQAPPAPDLDRYRGLRAAGVNRVSFCFEVFDPDRFREVCPGKAETYGLKRYLDTIAHCAAMPRPSGGGMDGLLEPWVVNGEIIAGLEPVESTLKAIDWITAAGAIPTVCVFRPLRGTDYESLPPPRTEDLIAVFARLHEACLDRGLPVGVAPNVKVSLVLLPEECAALVAGSRRRWLLRRAARRAQAAAFAAWFYRRRDRAMAAAPSLGV